MARLVPGKKICRSAVAELAGVLQRVSALVFLGQIKGRVRFLGMLEVYSCRKRGQRGSRATARSSSSPQIERKLSSSPHRGKAMGSGFCF
jgi:hypothetical protein